MQWLLRTPVSSSFWCSFYQNTFHWWLKANGRGKRVALNSKHPSCLPKLWMYFVICNFKREQVTKRMRVEIECPCLEKKMVPRKPSGIKKKKLYVRVICWLCMPLNAKLHKELFLLCWNSASIELIKLLIHFHGNSLDHVLESEQHEGNYSLSVNLWGVQIVTPL